MDAHQRWKIENRVADLVALESELVRKLEQCVPPVDLHRRELERVRSEIATVRSEETPDL